MSLRGRRPQCKQGLGSRTGYLEKIDWCDGRHHLAQKRARQGQHILDMSASLGHRSEVKKRRPSSILVNTMKRNVPLCILSLALAMSSFGQRNEVGQFIRVQSPVVALTHVRVVDGTGTAAVDDQTVVIIGGKIASVGPTASASGSCRMQRR